MTFEFVLRSAGKVFLDRGILTHSCITTDALNKNAFQ